MSKKYLFVFLLSLFVFHLRSFAATNLQLGADYQLRGVSIKERDVTFAKRKYYDQRLQAYLITDLSQDVEANIRVQSITPWGLEGSTTSLGSRYPEDNGGFFIQNAFVRLPNIWRNRIVLTIGRQPIKWGEGRILDDDELGFNAIRAQIRSPWDIAPFDLDLFTAKIEDNITTPGDTDLHGVKLGFNRNRIRWEFMGLVENSDNPQTYTVGSSTFSTTATKIERRIMGVRAITTVKDAFIKGEYYIQDGDIRRTGFPDMTLGGSAFVIGLGAKANTRKIGRFGVIAELMEGSGDSDTTSGEDEAFRPTFASRWNGLEREGNGRYFAGTLSDAYSPMNPFGPASSNNTGLPTATSGIKTIHFGVESTPWAKWTFTFDFYNYAARKNIAGSKELGAEFDYGFIYRYSGLVTIKGNTSRFNPGEAYPAATQQNASFTSLEAELKF